LVKPFVKNADDVSKPDLSMRLSFLFFQTLQGLTMISIENQLHKLIQKEFGVAPANISQQSLLADLGDSLDGVSLIAAVEESFDITITNEQLAELHTVGQLINFLQSVELVHA
jgi:acyl carrier protein